MECLQWVRAVRRPWCELITACAHCLPINSNIDLLWSLPKYFFPDWRILHGGLHWRILVFPAFNISNLTIQKYFLECLQILFRSSNFQISSKYSNASKKYNPFFLSLGLAIIIVLKRNMWVTHEFLGTFAGSKKARFCSTPSKNKLNYYGKKQLTAASPAG